MSRAMFGSMATHITGETLTLCHCWQITLTSGTVHRLTDHDQDLVFLGETFVSDGGFDISMLESGENLSVDNADLAVLFKSGAVSKSDIENGFFNGSRVNVYLVNWSDTSSYCHLPGGFLTKVKDFDVGSGVFELSGLAAKTNQNVGRKLIPTCDADVGDSRCGVDMGPYTVTGSVTSVTNNQVFTDSSNAESSGYFNYGNLTWTSGNNAGVVCEVKLFASGQFTLLDPTPSQIQVGDGYSAQRGCDRTSDTCKNVFNNYINYRGHPFVVGTREALSGPR